MPTGNEMYRLLNSLDLAYKSEMVLYQLHSIIFWTTTLELAMFSALLVLFFAAAKSMAIMWLTFVHVPRSVIGAFLLKKLPKSHEIIEDLKFDVIVFDTAPTGHTLKLLNFPNILEKGINKLAFKSFKKTLLFLLT